MEVSIIKADWSHLDDCAEILQGSKLGMTYFLDGNGEYIGRDLLKDGFEKNEIYVAQDEGGESIGFSWIQLNGIFNWFPFLHVVVVKEDRRGQGIGKALMQHFEELAFVEDGSHEAFLMVGDYNTEAIRLYEKQGYSQVGAIPELFVGGVTEILMMKRR